MHPIRRRKLFTALWIVFALAVAATLILAALRRSIDLYYTPAQLLAAQVREGKSIRLGGLVKQGSVLQNDHDLQIQFVITDYHASVPVRYCGVLPNLFREGQGVIVSGYLQAGQFVASQVLAKHDENYRPPNIRQE